MSENYFHIVTPFSRPENFGRLCENLAAAGLKNGRGHWTPIFTSEHDRETTFMGQYHTEPVITALVTREAPMDWDPCYWKLNEWLKQATLLDEQWCGFLPDDDTYDAGFFEGLDRAIESSRQYYLHAGDGEHRTSNIELPTSNEWPGPDVVVVSARRFEPGDSQGSHWVLPACVENLRRCRIGLEQFFIRGRVLKKYRFENEATADGGLMERMKADGVRFGFAPELYVNWNALRGATI